MKPIALAALSALALSATALGARAAIVSAVYDPTGHHVIDFEDQPATSFPGVVYDGVLSSGGADLAERFVGQTLSFAGNNDVLSGTPSGPLTLMVGAPSRNLDLGTDNGTHNLIPCGTLGCSDGAGYGEGAFAVKFAAPVSYFGFAQFFADSVDVKTTLDFFDSSGGLLGRVTTATFGSFAFTSTDGRDIAGVSVFTADPGGLAYDDLLYDVPGGGVPEPAAWTLLIAGFGLAGAALRRRRVVPAFVA